MLKKGQRFTRKTFPTSRPSSRRHFSWGTVSFFDTEPRMAVVVSKKALKKAHDRNRAKRRAYSVLENIVPEQGLVVHLRSEALTAKAEEMQQDIESALKKVA